MKDIKIKDLPIANQPIWFAKKTFGYGWTPCSKKGWITFFVLIVFFVVNFTITLTLMSISEGIPQETIISNLLLGQLLMNIVFFLISMILITRLTGEAL